MSLNRNMRLTGNFKPQTGVQEVYTVKFEKVLTKSKTFNIQVGKAGKLYLPNNTGPNFGNISVGGGQSQFTFGVLWIDEQPNVLLSVFDQSGEFGTVDKVFDVTSQKCTLSKSLSAVKVGESFTVKSKLSSLINFSAWDIVQDWSFSTDLLKKNGDCTYDRNTQTISLPLIAIKTGNATVSVVVNAVNPKERVVIEKFYRGSLDFEIANPYSISMDNAKNFACEGAKFVYRMNGLGINPSVKEQILWKCNSYGKLISEQGKGVANFETIKNNGFFTVSAEVTADSMNYLIDSNNRVWIGKPTFNPKVKSEHTISAGDEIRMKLTEFDHYSGNIEYSIESGNRELFEIERISVNEVVVTSNHPKIVSDKIELKFTASNICGEVSNVRTIVVESGLGSSFENSIQVKFDQNHGISYMANYNLRELGGDIRNFKLYFTFNLTRKAHFSRGIYASSSFNSNLIKMYDHDQKELENIETSDLQFRTGILPIGKYYIVVDVKNDIAKEDILKLSISGGAAGGDHPTNPYVIDVDSDEFEFKDRIDTNGYYKEFKYIDENGEMVIYDKSNRGREIFYSLTLTSVTQLLIDATTNSTVNPEFHIMQGTPYDWKVLYHDDGKARPGGEDQRLETWDGEIRWKRILGPGKYIFVFNGAKWGNAGQLDGVISTHILGRKIKGTSFDNSYELGHCPGREYSLERRFHDILAHERNGVEKIFFHFSIEKNVDVDISALAGESYLSVELYNSMGEVIPPSMYTPSRFIDLLEGDFYFAVSLADCKDDRFDLKLKTVRRGLTPFDQKSYNMGVYDSDFIFADDINTAEGGFHEFFRYRDENGDYPYISSEANQFYYKITLLCDMLLLIDTNWNITELHLMQGEPYEWKVLHHKDPYKSFMDPGPVIVNLKKGEYKMVFNRLKTSNGGVNNGPISLSVAGSRTEK